MISARDPLYLQHGTASYEVLEAIAAEHERSWDNPREYAAILRMSAEDRGSCLPASMCDDSHPLSRLDRLWRHPLVAIHTEFVQERAMSAPEGWHSRRIRRAIPLERTINLCAKILDILISWVVIFSMLRRDNMLKMFSQRTDLSQPFESTMYHIRFILPWWDDHARMTLSRKLQDTPWKTPTQLAQWLLQSPRPLNTPASHDDLLCTGIVLGRVVGSDSNQIGVRYH